MSDDHHDLARMTTALLDTAIGFTIPHRHARGRVLRLGPALDTILSKHAYPPVVAKLLAEALTLGALLGSTLKQDDGRLTLQAQAEGGAIDLMVVNYEAGVLRGYVRHDADRIAELPVDPTFFALFGKGYLAITFDLPAIGERYQGIVPLEGASLADAAESYFAQSEQLPSIIRLSAVTETDGRHVAGGMLIQHLPEGEEGRDRIHTRMDHPEWDHVRALAETVKGAELADRDLPLETLLWRLFNEEEVRTLPALALTQGCRCDPEHFRSVLARFPADERAEMADEAGQIHVDCEFCSTRYSIALESLDA